jgi:16S rRNA (cytosine1402-N4)-methyltransferase
MASITTQTATIPHKTVLKAEAVEYLLVKKGGTYIDATFGAGGHTKALLEADPTCRVIALDWDGSSIEKYGAALKEAYGDRLTLVWSNFAQLYQQLRKLGITTVDGILADFGTSQMQLSSKAGFSFNADTPLDMRMSSAHQAMTAAQVVNTAPEEKLTQIFKQLGEERFARAIARAIVEKRSDRKFATTKELAELVSRVVPRQGHQRIHPATKVFQALRIYVNHELDNITALLAAAYRIVSLQGRIVCISFHSLEDRIVKESFREREAAGEGTVLTKKVVVPSDEEIRINPSSRSAKMRVFECLRAGGRDDTV